MKIPGLLALSEINTSRKIAWAPFPEMEIPPFRLFWTITFSNTAFAGVLKYIPEPSFDPLHCSTTRFLNLI